ncbi:MAG TPA: NHL repeat-containing protein [Pyrinomonadaceae bacterium]|nr:NHL repeat-containing protein [Pyrinomonadaceae bacterium]
MPRPRSLPRGKLLAAALLALAGLAVFLFLLPRLRQHTPPRPTGTVAGWRAVVTSVAGSGSPAVSDAAAGAPLTAGFAEPFGLAADGAGNLYVSDAGESNRIRKLSPDGSVSTLAGGAEGFADGAGAAASFHTPSGIALDREGNLYVADTGNNRVRKVTKEGVVTTLAGDGTAGHRDGPAAQAQFNGPVGVAVDADGQVYVADTYNDRVRLVTKDGAVRTIAGTGAVGFADGDALGAAQLDTPCGVAVGAAGEVYVADTGNNRLRRLTREGQLTTLSLSGEDGAPADELSRPVGLALTRDGFLYVSQLDRGRLVQVAPDMRVRPLAGLGSGFADGEGLTQARFNQPAGLTLTRDGALYVADSANYLVRRVEPFREGEEAARPFEGQTLPLLSAADGGPAPFPWPLDPQDGRHEVVGTLGEVRGSFDTDDSRHHLHSGLDVFGPYGKLVRASRDEKVRSPLPNWGFGHLNEGLRVGLVAYIHQHVGRDEKGVMLAGTPFLAVRDEAGKVVRVRVRRGTRVRRGDALGTVNRMYHVHLNFGPPGAELNPLLLPLPNFSDSVRPTIERDGLQLFDAAGARFTERRGGRLVVRRGPVRIVLDAYDRADGNSERRRLGLYRLGFQILTADGRPAPGFDEPRTQIEFDRLPPDREATKIAYADESGITVYGSQRTRFLYELTNTLRGGRAERGAWDASALPPGDYLLRVFAADFAGNLAEAGRDLPLTLE